MPGPSLDNIFGDAAATPTAVPSTGPSLDNIFGEAPAAAPSSGPSVDNIFAAPKGNVTPSPLPLPQMSSPGLPPAPKPVDTSNIFSKFLGFASGAISKAIAPPDQSKLGTDANKNTLAYLPSELARQIPGVADLQDNPELAQYVTPEEVAQSAPGAIADVAKGFIKAPISAVADLYDAGRVFLGKNPNAKFNIPGLGEVTSDVYNVSDAIKNGQDPVVAALSAGSSSIFNALFFADIVNRVAGPRGVKVYEKTGNISDLTGQTVDTGPKSGRLYQPPTAYNRGGAQVLPPEVLSRIQEQGIPMGKSFNSEQPVYFKVTVGKGGAYTGEMIQLKPSYLKTAYDAIFGTKEGPTSVPALLGEPSPVDSKVPTPAEIGPFVNNATPKDVTVLHSQTVKEGDIKTSMNNTLMGKDQKATPTPPAPPKAPIVPTVTETVAHNVLRLGQGDTSRAKEGADVLQKEIKAVINEHGPDVTALQLQEKIGVSPETAQQLINEAKAPSTPAEIQAAHNQIASQILGARSDAQIKIDAEAHVAQSQQKLVDKYIAEHGNYVGADESKEFMPGYSQDRSISDLVQKGASQLSDAVYNHLLDKNQGEKNNTVLITGGGTGVGKSTALRNSGINTKDFSVVFDSNSANFPAAKARIDNALSKGYKVEFMFVHAPVDKAYDRVLDRAEQMTQEKGSSRPVSAQGHMDMHSGAPNAAAQILEHYKNNSRVKISIFDNAKTEPSVIKPEHHVDFIRNIVDNKGNETETHKGLNEQRSLAAHEGRISEKTNTGFERAERLRPAAPKNNGGNVEKSPHGSEGKAGANVLNEKGETIEGRTIERVGTEGVDRISAENGTIDRGTGLTPEDAEQAQADWEENYSDKYLELSDQVSDLRRELKTAPKAQQPSIQAQINALNARGAALEDQFIEEHANVARSDLQRGFIAPGKMAEDIASGAKKVRDTMQQIENARELTGDVRTGIYQHENTRKALRVRLTQMVEHVGNVLDAQGWENLYHHDENKGEPLSEKEQQIYNNFISPLKHTLTDIIAQYRQAGGTITSDLFFMENGEYTPRFAKDKQSALDKLIDQGKKAVRSIQNGGLLSKSLGTVGKSRKFYAATDENGKRTTVYVPIDKSENVLGFQGGKVNDLGPVKGMKSPKVKEFFDDTVMRKLNDLASALGVTHERVAVGQSKGLGPYLAGVSFRGESLIKTRLSPSSVLAHELGHQIDQKYGMQEFMKEERYDPERKQQLTDEMRQLADKRFEGRNVSDNFKKYVRKGTEKMAVMFEAYISNREMFKEVAPHLYDDFRDFLNNHEELRPFLDIQPGVSLGGETHGGEQSGKIGAKFVDKEGNKYTIGQATTKEIEANTSTEYHKNVLANYVVALDRATNALNAMRLLDRLKNEEEFGTIIKQDSPDEAPPEGWKSVSDQLPQFRGYHMEPRTAEALTDLAGRQRGSMYIPVFDEVNNFLTTAIVLNPIMHVPNVIAGRSLAAASGDISSASFKNLGRAYNEVRNKGPLYLDYLEHGAPFMALKDTAKSFTDAIFNQYTDEVERDPEVQNLIKTLGYDTPKAFIEGFKKINEGVTWGSNDIFFMHALMDYQDSHEGSTMEGAIKEVSKRMADYRIPERILLPGAAGRALSVAAQSRVFMFGRFHYTGVIKPWIEAARDSATGNAQDRIAGLRGLAYLLIMGLAVWPYMNKMWQGITGSPTSYESMPGPLRPIQVGQKLKQQGPTGIPAALQSIFAPSPAIRSLIEMGFNVDLFTRNPIYGPLPAEGLTTYGTSVVSPLASASRMNPGDFALSMFGVWTPKNVEAKTALDQMKYSELPALQTQVKKDLATGQVDKANAEMADFNTKAIATWNQYELETGGKNLITTEAQKQDFLKTWGIKTPGALAMTHANALYGNGSLTNKSSLIDTVATYAKAIGVDPAEAFHLIFSGQSIARVTNFGLFNADSAIIVQRMSLSASQQQKGLQEQGQGDASGNGLQLDHVIPLEAGGTNDAGNLNLITTEQDGGEQQQLEDLLGKAVKEGKISQANVREFSIRYKAGHGETLPDEYMKEFADKYGSKPLTLADVQAVIDK